MEIGFEFEAARSKRDEFDDAAPVQQKMRERTPFQRKPSADQKKVRRKMQRAEQASRRRTAAPYLLQPGEVARFGPNNILVAMTLRTATTTKESITMSTPSQSFQQREAALVRALAVSTDYAEQQRLTADLERVRAERTAAVQAERDLDLANTVVRDTLTPVATFERHTAATDWITEQPTSGAEYDHAMQTAATLWMRNVHEAVLADPEEFAEQARGMARREAGKYGEDAIIAGQVFLDTAERLRSMAADGRTIDPNQQNGNAESTVTDYDTETDQTPQYAEDWPGAEAEGVHPPMPGAGEKVWSASGTGDYWEDSTRAAASRTAAEADRPHAYDNGDPIGGGWGSHDVPCKVCGKPANDPAHLFGTDGRYSTSVKTAVVHAPSSEVVWDGDSDHPACEPSQTLSNGDTTTASPDDVTCPDCRETLWLDGDPHEGSRKTAISLINVGIEGPGVGVGTNAENGNRITFRLSPKEEADLKAVLYSDLAVNFSGVDIEESDVISWGPIGRSDRAGDTQPPEPLGFSSSLQTQGGDPAWLTERNNDPYGTNAWGKPHEFWSTVDYEDMGGPDGDAYRVFEKDGRWYAYHRRQNYWMKLSAGSKEEARKEVEGMNAGLDMWASLKTAADHTEGQRYIEGLGMTRPATASLRTTAARPIYEIAADIKREWGQNVNYAAKPYLDAMMYLNTINDKFGEDEGKWVVAYFLNNAASFRGEKAKALKEELKAIQKGASRTSARTHTEGQRYIEGLGMTRPATASLRTTAARPIYEIAADIKREWGQNVNYAAKPYLDAMMYLNTINDKFGEDEGKWVVAYFLNNAASFRGEKAKALKEELKAIQKGASRTSARTAAKGDTFSLSDAKNEDGEWIMSPEQIRAEMAYSDEEDPDDFYRDASVRTANVWGQNSRTAERSTDKAPGRWVVEVLGNGESKWARNSLTFDSREDAVAYAKDLSGRWFGMDVARVRQIPEGGLPASLSEDADLSDPDIVVNYRTASRTAAETPGNDQNGNATSGVPQVEVGDEGDKPMWPVDLPGDSVDPSTGDDAANVAGVPTPGGESGYPQPRNAALDAFRAKVQANLNR